MEKFYITIAHAINWSPEAVHDKIVRDRQEGTSMKAIEQQFVQLAAAFGNKLVFVSKDNN
jgi:hypothetical protein